jgi:hypothetical protein
MMGALESSAKKPEAGVLLLAFVFNEFFSKQTS